MSAAGELPLSGIRVVDMGRVIAAPYATQILADLGADVIKIEAPGKGDAMRSQGVQIGAGPEGAATGLTPHFLSVNRNKRSIAIDLTTPGGQSQVRQLVADAQVVVENFKTGDLVRYGLDYASLKAVNPGLIYCSITGFGQFGPYARRPATDGVFQALSGMMSITGERHGQPARVGLVISDVIAGVWAATAILAALREREVLGGSGRHIDLALLDVAIATMSHQAVHYLNTGEVPHAEGSAAAGSAPAQAFELKDGYLLIQAASNDAFAKLCNILGCDELLAEPGFATPLSRYRNLDRLIPPLATKIRSWSIDALWPRLTDAGIISAPVRHLGETFEDPQVKARGVAEAVGGVTLVSSPLAPSGMTRQPSTMPPKLNEHGEAILAMLSGSRS